jgi:molybdate transport system substrate-binding protein
MFAAPAARSAGVLVVVALLSPLGPAEPAMVNATAAEGVLTVSAAISLSDVMQEIAAAYRQSGGAPVRFNLAGSNALARQIVNGAPADVFISADDVQMAVAEAAGAIVGETKVIVAANQLAIVTLPERADALADGLPPGGDGIRRLAIGDPSAVPAGVYARAYLERKGLWNTYQRHIVPTSNVRAALTAVENGSADAAILYMTDARHSKKVRVAFAIPLNETPFIGYRAAIVSRTANRRAARRFLDFLGGPEARRIFASHGFLPVPDVR